MSRRTMGRYIGAGCALLFASAIGVLGALQPWANADEAAMTATFREIRDKGLVGVIVPAAVATAYWRFEEGREPEGPWEVGEDKVREMEAGLADYLRGHDDPKVAAIAERLNQYQRQYFAVLDEGQHQIELRAMCDRYIEENDIDLMKDVPGVDDGGDCFFEARYNADMKAFLWARVHGES